MTWLQRLLGREDEHPEVKFVLSVDEDFVIVRDPKDREERFAKRDLRKVVIRTDDAAPTGSKVMWQFYGVDGKIALSFPQGATGENRVVDWLMTLPGCDHRQMLRAIGATKKALFPIWEAPAPGI